MKDLAHLPINSAMVPWRAAAFFLAMVAALLGPGLLAQGPLTLSAIALADEGNLEEAESVLLEALSGPEGNDAMTWYVQAFVLKEQYVQAGKQPESPKRTQALESLRTLHSKRPAATP